MIIKSEKSNVEANIEESIIPERSERINIVDNSYDNLHMDTSVDLNESMNSSHESIDNMLTEAGSSRSSVKTPPKKTLVIICSGNGACYEVFHKNPFWLNFYLNKNCDVCIWNYRGYGLSTGRATLNNVTSDSELLYTYLTTVHRYKRVVIHGISIGGIPACHLGRTNKLETLIVDRSFSSLSEVVKNLVNKGNFLEALYKVLFCFEKDSNNLANFQYAMNNCRRRVIISDSNDTIIKEKASLLTHYTKIEVEGIFGSGRKMLRTILDDNDKYLEIKDIFIKLNELMKEETKKEVEMRIHNSYLNLNEGYMTSEGVSGMDESLSSSQSTDESLLIQSVSQYDVICVDKRYFYL